MDATGRLIVNIGADTTENQSDQSWWNCTEPSVEDWRNQV